VKAGQFTPLSLLRRYLLAMINSYLINPLVINAIAVAGFVGLTAFTVAHIIATTAPVHIISAAPVEAAHVISQESYGGVIAWVSGSEIKITDNFGVSRIFSIDKSTDIVVHGFPVGKATYANLRVLDHVRVLALNDGSDARAQTIIVQ
jgi:hypothetical protein